MEKLLEMAKQRADQVEIYSYSSSSNDLSFENFKLDKIKNSIQTGVALRLIKDGFIGMSYTKNLLDRTKLIENALTSIKGKIKAKFSFPFNSQNLHSFEIYDKSIENIKFETLAEEYKQISNYIKENLNSNANAAVAATLNIMGSYGSNSIRILNSNGIDYKGNSSYYFNYPHLLFPNGYSHVRSLTFARSYKPMNKEKIQKMIDLYYKAYPEVNVTPGNYPTIFTPDVLYVLMWRFTIGANAKSLYEKITPLENKLGEEIFSKKLTIIDDPHMSDQILPRSFDDEGVTTSKLTIVDKGIFKNFYNNLEYAEKLKATPTGHGYKESAMGGDEPVSIKVSPTLNHLTILPGNENDSFIEMIKKMKKGVIVLGALGAHSGNLLNGDFSIGLAAGLYVENGEIIGRIKNGMVAGNIYQLMKNVSMVENKVHKTLGPNGGRYPSICFDDVKLSQ
ncbi:MAG: TldD/PmbA family protein [Oligoflexia bacterium]|nr:TldD/PmbA family protein [Oligoflexia bacterium]